MKKRLRKKKRVGEFQELCFELNAELRLGLAHAELETFVDRLIQAVEARQLAFAGGAGRDHKLSGVVTRNGRESTTEDDRAALAAFLASENIVVQHEIGALQDAWYGFE
jgi:uncharacterized protein YggL (DUF469 family)